MRQQAISEQTAANPAAEYRARLETQRQTAAHYQRRNLLFSYLRLLWALLFFLLLWYVLARHSLPGLLLLIPVLGFGATAKRHTDVLAKLQTAKRAMAWYEWGLSRLEDRWRGVYPRATPPAAHASLFAADLDLFGGGSLFELLCTSRTNLGQDRLASWLLSPADHAQIAGRQSAIQELHGMLDLREAVASAPGLSQCKLDFEALTLWAEEALQPLPHVLRWAGPLLALATLAGALWWALGHSALLLSSVLLVNGALTYLLQRRIAPLLAAAEQASAPLQLLGRLCALFESRQFVSPSLEANRTALHYAHLSATRALRRLGRLAGAVEQRANFVIKLLDFLFLYSIHLAMLVGDWRSQYGSHLRSWLETLAELEALLALSTYHYEHPGDPFPTIRTDAVFEVHALGHPLLPESACIRNDLRLDSERQLIIISGSNMSGKSTLLRAAGVACVMAMAGMPVRAVSLSMGCLHLAASIQVQDSLAQGRSRFYAEILRLRAICEMSRDQPPLLFLLDELLAGTNSQDRLTGATGVIKELLRAGALGLLSTHDLALTQLGSELQGSVRNAHFEDHFEGTDLRFDYTLRDGVITRSNGLDLMRLIGLDV